VYDGVKMPVGTKPAADVVLDASLVRALLEEQHPDLAHLEPVHVAEGWDNALFRLGDGLAVRLPRRAASATLIEQEQRWLPHLSSRLPVPVPVPLRVGVPSRIFGRAWSVVQWLPGRSLLDGAFVDPVTTGMQLQQFLRALHQPAPEDAPRNPARGVPLESRTATLHEHLRQLDGVVDRAAVLAEWDRALSAPPWPGPPRWLHGDLHPGNLLIEDGRLAGVIDFGDLTSGDPATDIAIRWMLPRSVRERFEPPAAGDQPEALAMRARGWALALGLAYLAHSREDAGMASLGHATVDAVLREP
jgi:aminoglycoside phosphotransferase (APT) family kinase protein